MIPVFEPDIGEEEVAAVADAVRRGEISGSFGESIPRFEEEFARYVGCCHGIAVSSGTTALHLAVAAAGIGPGDEVLVSASTNIATALAAYHNGAVPIPVDSEPETWNLDLDLLESLITPRTRAIIPVHLFGHPVNMPRLMSIAERYHLLVIEDCAESHGATAFGRMTGSFGAMGCFSFYANKVITTGEGGMITTNDGALADKLRLLRNLAFAKPRFWHQQAGFNFRITGMQAALGRVQLAKIEKLIAAKRQLAQMYRQALAGIPGLQLPGEAPWARNIHWMYALAIEDSFGVPRDRLAAALAREGIETRTFFCPINLQPCFQSQSGYRKMDCPVAERLWESGLYLPSGVRLAWKTVSDIAAHIRRLAGADRLAA